MSSVIKLKNGSGAPATSDLVQGEPAFDLTNKRLYTENASGAIIEIGTKPSTIDIDAGTIDGTIIGGTTVAAGSFAALEATTGAFSDTLAVTGAAIFSSTVSAAAGTYLGGTAASNLLDEYTGLLTYTPAFNNFGTGTYAVRVGRYNRVGKAVTVQLHLDVTALGTASGAVTFTLPLVASSASSYFGTAGAIHAQNWATAVEGLNVLVDAGTNRASLYYNAGKTTGAAAVTHAIMGTGNLVLTIHYFTD
jgi:hypothetical protein